MEQGWFAAPFFFVPPPHPLVFGDAGDHNLLRVYHAISLILLLFP
jgi:hypothetical protein